MNPHIRETLIGLAAASFSLVVAIALMEGGTSEHFRAAILLLLVSFISPLMAIPVMPWLVILLALAGGGIYLQYTRLGHRFMRYLVGVEVIIWQLFGMWCTANIVVAHAA